MLRSKEYAVVISLKEGGCYSTTAVGSMRGAIAEAFANVRKSGLEGHKVIFCKTADQMTDDEREQWDMMVPADLAMQEPAPARVWEYDLY